MGSLFDALRLCLALATVYPFPAERSCRAAVSIVLAADEFDPLLVAAIAAGESKFNDRAVNGLCRGPMQVRRGPLGSAGYAAGVAVLREASRWCARRGTPGRRCTISAYASGPRGPRLGLYRQPDAVLRRYARLRRAMAITNTAATRGNGA